MNWNIRDLRNHEGRQYKVLRPIPTDDGDRLLLENWKEHFVANHGIIETFFEHADPVIDNMMKGRRGEKWDYVAVDPDSNWPDEINIYEI